jgi:hypothetical protein
LLSPSSPEEEASMRASAVLGPESEIVMKKRAVVLICLQT